jgi:aspartyl-tRNA(Asn)/glutamyl-tRNA(Gln) amidotransferase subunit C
MADLTKEDVLKLARLSRLRLSESEVTEFQKEISEILEYVEVLGKVDTKGLKPTYQTTGLKNISRKDELMSYGPSQADLLKNVPSKDKTYIKTKRIL